MSRFTLLLVLAGILSATVGCSDSSGGGSPTSPALPEQPVSPPPTPPAPPAPLTFAVLGNAFNPVGITTDPQGNVYLSPAGAFNNPLLKINPNGNLIAQGVVPQFGRLVWWPSRSVILLLATDGKIYVVDPVNFAASLLVDLRAFPISTQAIYDVQFEDVSGFEGSVLPQFSIYGDIALLEREGRTDLFVTGVNQGRTRTFVVRLRISGNTGSASVIMSSRAVLSQPPPPLPAARHQATGIAVNERGTVIVTIPLDATYRLVAFSADFDPAAGVQQSNRPQVVTGSNAYGPSIGLSSDASGNFYVASEVTASLTVLPPQLNRELAQGTSLALMVFREVAVSPDKLSAYITAVPVGGLGDGALLRVSLSGFTH